MSTEEISEVIKLCKEVIASLSASTPSFKYDDRMIKAVKVTVNEHETRPNIEAFLGWLDLELVELKKMVEEYDKIELEELSVDEIEKRIKDLRQKVEQETEKKP